MTTHTPPSTSLHSEDSPSSQDEFPLSPHTSAQKVTTSYYRSSRRTLWLLGSLAAFALVYFMSSTISLFVNESPKNVLNFTQASSLSNNIVNARTVISNPQIGQIQIGIDKADIAVPLLNDTSWQNVLANLKLDGVSIKQLRPPQLLSDTPLTLEQSILSDALRSSLPQNKTNKKTLQSETLESATLNPPPNNKVDVYSLLTRLIEQPPEGFLLRAAQGRFSPNTNTFAFNNGVSLQLGDDFCITARDIFAHIASPDTQGYIKLDGGVTINSPSLQFWTPVISISLENGAVATSGLTRIKFKQLNPLLNDGGINTPVLSQECL